jgi:hypothetical protein
MGGSSASSMNWMQYSFGEGARPLVSHPQLLANFNTIEELGRKFLDALDEQRGG